MSLACMGYLAAGLLVLGQTQAGLVEKRQMYEQCSDRNFLPNNEDDFAGTSAAGGRG